MSPILTLSNLSKTYPRDVVALKSISLSLEKGDFFALLGPNGAGKSTTIGIISGLVEKTSGKVFIHGQDMDIAGPVLRKKIGVVPQELNFGIFEKVYDIVVDQAGYYGIPRNKARVTAEKYLHTLGLWEKRNAQARTLSGGMKRRLMIARALVHEPDILILDEPTAGVDIELRREMYDFLRELNRSGKTIILTTHYLEEAEALCHNMAIIDKGEIIKYGPIKKLLASMEDEVVTIEFVHPADRIASEKQDGAGGIGEKLQEYHPIVIESSLDLTISSQYTLDAAIKILQDEGYVIVSMKPKSGRLEEFFLKSTRK